MTASEPARFGSCHFGSARFGVTGRYLFDNLVAKFEARDGEDSCDVTRRRLSLGARDSETGHRDKEFSEDTVKGIFVPAGSTELAQKVGTYVRYNDRLFACAGFFEGDEVLINGKYYEVKAVQNFFWTATNFSHRILDLVYLPFHT